MKKISLALICISFIYSCSSNNSFVKREDLPKEAIWYSVEKQRDIPIEAFGHEIMKRNPFERGMESGPIRPGSGDLMEQGGIGVSVKLVLGPSLKLVGEIKVHCEKKYPADIADIDYYIFKAQTLYLFLPKERMFAVEGILQGMETLKAYKAQFIQQKNAISQIIQPYIDASQKLNPIIYSKITKEKGNIVGIVNRGYSEFGIENNILTLFSNGYQYISSFKCKKLFDLNKKLEIGAGTTGSEYFWNMITNSFSYATPVGEKVYKTQSGLLRSVPTYKVKYIIIPTHDGKPLLFEANR